MGKIRSIPISPDILRTVKFEAGPLPFCRRITTPWNACTRSRSPSRMRKFTLTVSPGPKGLILGLASVLTSNGASIAVCLPFRLFYTAPFIQSSDYGPRSAQSCIEFMWPFPLVQTQILSRRSSEVSRPLTHPYHCCENVILGVPLPGRRMSVVIDAQ